MRNAHACQISKSTSSCANTCIHTDTRQRLRVLGINCAFQTSQCAALSPCNRYRFQIRCTSTACTSRPTDPRYTYRDRVCSYFNFLLVFMSNIVQETARLTQKIVCIQRISCFHGQAASTKLLITAFDQLFHIQTCLECIRTSDFYRGKQV